MKRLLTLDGDGLAEFKQDFNTLLNNTILMMQEKNVEDASISVKFDIVLLDVVNPNLDDPASDSEQEIKVPTISHKITATMKTKAEKSGTTGGFDYKLVWDGENCAYAMVETGVQTSIFDEGGYDDEDAE